MIAARVQRDVIRAEGPDAATFLQGQLSQDIAALAADASAWSFLLQPQGKVEALLRCTRTGDHSFLLDVDAGWGPAVVERLERFKLRTKCDLSILDWSCISIRGDGWSTVDGHAGVVARAHWPVHDGIDLLGSDPTIPRGVEEAAGAELEELRLEAGWPAMGAEIGERTIPAELELNDLAVSFSKGCYTGQELVARIDSRGGNVPRRLRVLRAQSILTTGADVIVGDDVVGIVTSAAGHTGLALLARSVEPPASGVVDGIAVSVEAVPR